MPQRPPTLHASRSVDRHNQYDKWRGSSTERGYDYKWQRVRKLKLSLQPICELCDANDIVTTASIVHHFVHHVINNYILTTISCSHSLQVWGTPKKSRLSLHRPHGPSFYAST